MDEVEEFILSFCLNSKVTRIVFKKDVYEKMFQVYYEDYKKFMVDERYKNIYILDKRENILQAFLEDRLEFFGPHGRVKITYEKSPE